MVDFQLREAYNPRVLKILASRIKKAWNKFDDKGFVNAINPKLAPLNFGPRGKLIQHNLKKFLPNDFPKAAKILVNSLGPELSVEPGKTDWDSLIHIPVTEYVAAEGIDHYDIAMHALKEMTSRFSSENVVRPFIEKYEDKTLKLFAQWAKNKNVHVRRLVSEGTRPRLPLCKPLRKYKKDPKPILHLLDMLKDDKELYVRRSVANNLNDISKDNPDIVVALLQKWQKGASTNRNWLIKHALRTLLKRGHKGALMLLGYGQPAVKVKKLAITNTTIQQGGYLNFSLELESQKEQNLMIDYAIHFVKANGKLSDKVFKLAIKKAKKEKLHFTKKHSFKQMTTRKHYPGKHVLEIIVNGDRFETQAFDLQCTSQ